MVGAIGVLVRHAAIPLFNAGAEAWSAALPLHGIPLGKFEIELAGAKRRDRNFLIVLAGTTGDAYAPEDLAVLLDSQPAVGRDDRVVSHARNLSEEGRLAVAPGFQHSGRALHHGCRVSLGARDARRERSCPIHSLTRDGEAAAVDHDDSDRLAYLDRFALC